MRAVHFALKAFDYGTPETMPASLSLCSKERIGCTGLDLKSPSSQETDSGSSEERNLTLGVSLLGPVSWGMCRVRPHNALVTTLPPNCFLSSIMH